MAINEFANSEALIVIAKHCQTIFAFISNFEKSAQPFITPEHKEALLATATRLYQLIDEQLLTGPHEDKCGSETTWP